MSHDTQVLTWRLSPSDWEGAPGGALSQELLAVERDRGVTREVARAYVRGLPAMLGVPKTAMLPYVVPLAASQGVLRAAALEEPVDVPTLEYVQTSSVAVCEVLGAQVPTFSIRTRACLDALLEHGSAVTRVYVHDLEVAARLDAPFEILGSGEMPWFESLEIDEAFVPILESDDGVWLCWDRDCKTVVSVRPGKGVVVEEGEIVRAGLRELVESPRRFDGAVIESRGVLSWVFERNRFADAWFRATRDPDLGMGVWLVDVVGRWSSQPGVKYGHFGFYESELEGEARRVGVDTPRPVASLEGGRAYVPLRTEVCVDRGLVGWSVGGVPLHRMGKDARFPLPAAPDRARVLLTFFVSAFGGIGVLDWTLLEVLERAPSPRAIEHPGEVRDFVEIQGFLTCDGASWPMLDGELRVVPPPHSRTGERHVIPQSDHVEGITKWLGEAGRHVTVRGEVARSSKDVYRRVEREDGTVDHEAVTSHTPILWATSVSDATGVFAAIHAPGALEE